MGLNLEPPVKLFIMGENRWRFEYEWPLARTEYTEFFLHSGGAANTVRGDGVLSISEPKEESPDTYDYDPKDPVMSLMGIDAQAAPRDQSPLNGRKVFWSTKHTPAARRYRGDRTGSAEAMGCIKCP